MAGVSKGEKVRLVHEFRSITHKNVLGQNQFTFVLKERIAAKKQQVEELPRLHNATGAFYSGDDLQWKEYQPPGFAARVERVGGEDIRIGQILDPVEEIPSLDGKPNKVLHVTAVGPAGSGKTTLVRRFARDAVNGDCPQLQSGDRIVHLLDCRGFREDEMMSVREFLFTFMDHRPSDDEIEAGYEWMLENSENVLLVVDSLDTLPYKLDNESDVIGPHDSSRPATILYNIFTGKIFSRALILSSSREYAIKDYSGSLRPHKIISLGGFRKESIRNLVFGFLQEAEAQRVWSILEKKCTDLMALCETPVFLIFTLVGLIDGNSSFVPRNMTGILVKVIEILFHSEHAPALSQRSEKEMIEIINKMKELSLHGTEEGKVLFTEEDLARVRLATKEITDFTIVAPGRSDEPRYQILVETKGKKKMSLAMFSHQSMQEFLTSCQLSQMLADEFTSFARDKVHRPHYSVVRRMFCGLIMNEDVFQQASGHLLQVDQANVEKIRQLLAASMKEEFTRLMKGKRHGYELLEMFRAIHESGQGAKSMVPSHVDWIVFSVTDLMTSDMNAIASSIFYCDVVQTLHLNYCEKENIEAFNSKLNGSTVRIEVLVMSCGLLEAKGLFALGQLVKARAVPFLVCLALRSEYLQSLSDGLGDAKLNAMVLDGLTLNAEELKVLGKMVTKSETKILAFARIDVGEKEGKAFAKSMGSFKVEVLSMATEVALPSHPCGVIPGVISKASALLEMLPRVKNCLNLGGHELKRKDQILLRNKLDELYPEDPVIVFGGELDRVTCSWFGTTTLTSRQREMKTQVIGASGGIMHTEGCSIEFLPNTFTEESEIRYVGTRQGPELPDNHSPVSPALYYKSSKKLDKLAKVKISTWVATSSPLVMVNILCKKDEEDWKVFKSMRLCGVRNREIEFECSAFSWYILTLKDRFH